MTKLNRLSRPDALLPLRAVLLCVLCWAAGCASNPGNEALVDPLKQRLLAREDIALQNLLLARTPAYSYAGSGGGSGRRGGYSYLDAPYNGPAIEPPLPDLNMLPEDMPPWEDLPEPTPEPQPTPMEPAPTDADPAPTPPPATPEPTPEATPEATPEVTPGPEPDVTAIPAPVSEPSPAAEPPPAL